MFRLNSLPVFVVFVLGLIIVSWIVYWISNDFLHVSLILINVVIGLMLFRIAIDYLNSIRLVYINIITRLMAFFWLGLSYF